MLFSCVFFLNDLSFISCVCLVDELVKDSIVQITVIVLLILSVDVSYPDSKF